MIFLGLGSNLGDKVAQVEQALTRLPAKDIAVRRCSSLYQTAPWGVRNQDRFVNLVCEVSFTGEAPDLLARVLEVEQEMGRVRVQKWGPRLIDIDIVEFHGQQVHTPTLTLPHPFYLERDFVLVPLAELEPHWVPTGQREVIGSFITRLGETGIQRLPRLSP
jgi:2-amino-4-hydroxy-6-hydroxymethyldihydropteridine diphosphokinase